MPGLGQPSVPSGQTVGFCETVSIFAASTLSRAARSLRARFATSTEAARRSAARSMRKKLPRRGSPRQPIADRVPVGAGRDLLDGDRRAVRVFEVAQRGVE